MKKTYELTIQKNMKDIEEKCPAAVMEHFNLLMSIIKKSENTQDIILFIKDYSDIVGIGNGFILAAQLAYLEFDDSLCLYIISIWHVIPKYLNNKKEEFAQNLLNYVSKSNILSELFRQYENCLLKCISGTTNMLKKLGMQLLELTGNKQYKMISDFSDVYKDYCDETETAADTISDLIEKNIRYNQFEMGMFYYLLGVAYRQKYIAISTGKKDLLTIDDIYDRDYDNNDFFQLDSLDIDDEDSEENEWSIATEKHFLENMYIYSGMSIHDADRRILENSYNAIVTCKLSYYKEIFEDYKITDIKTIRFPNYIQQDIEKYMLEAKEQNKYFSTVDYVVGKNPVQTVHNAFYNEDTDFSEDNIIVIEQKALPKYEDDVS